MAQLDKSNSGDNHVDDVLNVHVITRNAMLQRTIIQCSESGDVDAADSLRSDAAAVENTIVAVDSTVWTETANVNHVGQNSLQNALREHAALRHMRNVASTKQKPLHGTFNSVN